MFRRLMFTGLAVLMLVMVFGLFVSIKDMRAGVVPFEWAPTVAQAGLDERAPADDDEPPPIILVWWKGCRFNDVRYTNGVVSCYMPDGMSLAWSKTCSTKWVRERTFPYEGGGEMTGVACFSTAP